MTPRRQSGFTLIELMIVVAIVGITAMFAVPAWQGMQSDNRAKAAAREVANAFQVARSQAIVGEGQMVVYFAAGAATDACGTPLPAPIVVLDDTDGNCCINGAETTMNMPDDPAREFAGLNWGVTFAAAQVPADVGGGAFAGGSSFTGPAGNPTRWVLFRPDGVPVGFDGAACNIGGVGSGAGGVYLTNGGGATGSGRDYAVVLSALGTSRVHAFNRNNGLWNQ